jgi:hypothetical protein
LPAGAEIFLPPWEDVPDGWFEIGDGAAGIPAGRKLIANKFSFNYIDTDTVSWGIIQPVNMFSDAARTNNVTISPQPVGGVQDTTLNSNHWFQNTNSARPIWSTYQRDNETVHGLRSENINQFITVPLDGTGTGAILFFFDESALYAPADFKGQDVDLYSAGRLLEEAIFFSRTLTQGEAAEFISSIQRDRNRKSRDNWNGAEDPTSLTDAFRNFWFITDFPFIDITGKTDLTNTWRGCDGYTSFPKLNTSAVVSFKRTWYENKGLTAFPKINTINGEDFDSTWFQCWNIIDFPKLNFVNAKQFPSTWRRCDNMENFPQDMFNDSVTNDFDRAFESNKLNQQSVDNILVSIANMVQTYNPTGPRSSGKLDITDGAATPSATGQAAADTLRNAGWTVNLEGY